MNIKNTRVLKRKKKSTKLLFPRHTKKKKIETFWLIHMLSNVTSTVILQQIIRDKRLLFNYEINTEITFFHIIKAGPSPPWPA